MPRSKPVAGTIGTIFGGLWAFIAATALPEAWRFPAALLAGLVTLSIVVRLWRQPAPQGAPRRLFGTKTYQLAVVLEVAGIYAASALLARYGMQSYFIEVVGIIVGLHFIGLWSATGSARFLGIAAGMCIISALAIALPETVGLVRLRDGVTGLGNAIILWFGASRSGD